MGELVHKVSYVDANEQEVWLTAQEFIEMPTAQRVLITVGDSKIQYWDADGNEVRKGKAIVYFGKKRREWMDSNGMKY